MDVMKSYPFPLNTHFGIAVTEYLGIGYFEGISFDFTQKCFQTFRPGHEKNNEGLQMEICTIKNQH